MEFIRRYKAPVAVLSVLAVLGAVFYVLQLVNGLGVTGMSNRGVSTLQASCSLLDCLLAA